MKRVVWVLVVVAVIAAGVMAWPVVRPHRPARPPAAGITALDLHLWHWSGARTLTSAEERDLAAAGVGTICQWIGAVEAVDGQPRLSARGGAVQGLASAPRWVVVRVEGGCTPMFDDACIDVVIELAVQAFQRAAQRGMPVGLQIDWDIPERRLAQYARFLEGLRVALPDGTGLSCTGLLCWLRRKDVAQVVAAVDWWVPQCYAGDVPADPRRATALVACGDLERVVAQCEALERPYRIGLPLYETAAVWDRDLVPVNNALPLSAESACATGLPLTATVADERLLRFTVPRDQPVASRRVAAGATVQVGMPTVGSLARRLATVRANAGAWCQGVSLFRLACANDLPALSPAQVRAAVQGVVVRPDVAWRWDGGPGAWTLVVENRGLADLVAVERPLRLRLPWHGALPSASPPSGLRWGAAASGEGLLIEVGFLRAGATLRLPALPADARQPPPCLAEAGTVPAGPLQP